MKFVESCYDRMQLKVKHLYGIAWSWVKEMCERKEKPILIYDWEALITWEEYMDCVETRMQMEENL